MPSNLMKSMKQYRELTTSYFFLQAAPKLFICTLAMASNPFFPLAQRCEPPAIRNLSICHCPGAPPPKEERQNSSTAHVNTNLSKTGYLAQSALSNTWPNMRSTKYWCPIWPSLHFIFAGARP